MEHRAAAASTRRAAISARALSLKLAESLLRRGIEARLREALFLVGLSIVALVLALAGSVFLLMALWGALAAYLGLNVASLYRGLALLAASIAAVLMAMLRATPRRRARG